jgi:hypothetical protein
MRPFFFLQASRQAGTLCAFALLDPSSARWSALQWISPFRLPRFVYAIAWRENTVMLNTGGYLTLWIEGLAENADRNNVRVYWEQRRLPVEFVSSPDAIHIRQVNVRVPAFVETGPCRLEVRHGDARAEITVEVC